MNDQFLNCMAQHTGGGFLPRGPLLCLPLFAMDLINCALFPVERGDFVGVLPPMDKKNASQRLYLVYFRILQYILAMLDIL